MVFSNSCVCLCAKLSFLCLLGVNVITGGELTGIASHYVYFWSCFMMKDGLMLSCICCLLINSFRSTYRIVMNFSIAYVPLETTFSIEYMPLETTLALFKIGLNTVPTWHATCELFLHYKLEDVKVWMVMSLWKLHHVAPCSFWSKVNICVYLYLLIIIGYDSGYIM
jgi:hypothetical protein